jgi:hypothetical protein
MISMKNLSTFLIGGDISKNLVSTATNFAWPWYLLAFLLFVFLPDSGAGYVSMHNWHDQSVFLKAVEETAVNHHSILIEQGVVGQGYVAITLAFSRMLGINHETSLILLSRLSYLATAILLVAFAWSRAIGISNRWFRSCAMAMALMIPASSVWPLSSDLPWTHFLTTALLTALIITIFSKNLPMFVQWGLIGLLSTLIWQTRMFEGLVILVAGGLTLMWVCLLRIMWRIDISVFSTRFLLTRAFAMMLGALISIVFIIVMNGNFGIYKQYSNQSDIMGFVFEIIFPRLVQLFFDPCFLAVCQYSDYTPHGFIPRDLSIWWQPLSLQLPGIVAAPASLIVILICGAVWCRHIFQPQVLFTLLTAGGLMLAYTSGLPSGSAHLKYGFFRDFVASMVMFGMVSITMFASLAIPERATHRAVNTMPQRIAPLLPLSFIAITAILLFFRTVGLPRIEGYHLDSVDLQMKCEGSSCRLDTFGMNTAGTAVPLPGPGLLKSVCGGQANLHVVKPSTMVLDKSDCTDGIKIWFLPAIVGLIATPQGEVFLSGDALTLATGNSVRKPAENAVKIDEVVTFNSAVLGRRIVRGGWATPEPWGIWSIGTKSRLVILATSLPRGNLKLTIEGAFFINSQIPSNSAEVFVNGKEAALIESSISNNKEIWDIEIQNDSTNDKNIVIDFHYKHARSPKSINFSEDERPIAFGLYSIKFSAINPSITNP